jgi:hypothetical protein
MDLDDRSQRFRFLIRDPDAVRRGGHRDGQDSAAGASGEREYGRAA